MQAFAGVMMLSEGGSESRHEWQLVGTIRLPISLSRSKHRMAALRQFVWLQHLSPIPDHFRSWRFTRTNRKFAVVMEIPAISHAISTNTPVPTRYFIGTPCFLLKDLKNEHFGAPR